MNEFLGKAKKAGISRQDAKNAKKSFLGYDSGGGLRRDGKRLPTEEDLMYVIRNIFVAKPGSASKLAAQLKEATVAFQMPNARVLTDLTGEFNRVIMEHTAESMDEFEKKMHEAMSSPMYRERMAGYTELWLTGTREILRVA